MRYFRASSTNRKVHIRLLLWRKLFGRAQSGAATTRLSMRSIGGELRCDSRLSRVLRFFFSTFVFAPIYSVDKLCRWFCSKCTCTWLNPCHVTSHALNVVTSSPFRAIIILGRRKNLNLFTLQWISIAERREGEVELIKMMMMMMMFFTKVVASRSRRSSFPNRCRFFIIIDDFWCFSAFNRFPNEFDFLNVCQEYFSPTHVFSCKLYPQQSSKR